jgi:hypothetical protein
MKHLDHEYELEAPVPGLITHFHQTIENLGGWIGVGCISIVILLFYLYVIYTITSGRKKREAEKLKRKQK